MYFENKITLSILIFLAIFSGVEVYFLNTQTLHKAKNYGHYPDSYGYGLSLNRFNETGALTETVIASKAVHYPDSKTTELSDIVLTLFNQKGHSPWVITAPFAVVYQTNGIINTTGAVHMHQAAGKKNPEVSVDTENVQIDTKKKLISTQAPVSAKQPGVTLNGVGAEYNYEQDHLSILSKVQANYQPGAK